MDAEQAAAFQRWLATVPTIERLVEPGVNPLTGEPLPYCELLEHAEWLLTQEWAGQNMVADAVEAVEVEHGKPWEQVVRDRKRAESATCGVRVRMMSTPRRVARRRESHGLQRGHRCSAGTRAGPDDPNEPAAGPRFKAGLVYSGRGGRS
jgi:hypothetical protein